MYYVKSENNIKLEKGESYNDRLQTLQAQREFLKKLEIFFMF